jgi:hypothetical protein
MKKVDALGIVPSISSKCVLETNYYIYKLSFLNYYIII